MWDQMPASFSKNCWHHTGLLVGTEVTGVENDTEPDILVAMAALVAPRPYMAIDFTINPEHEKLFWKKRITQV